MTKIYLWRSAGLLDNTVDYSLHMEAGRLNITNHMTPSTPANLIASGSLHIASILDQMPVGIGLFDKSGDLIHANRHFENVAGGPIPSIRSMSRDCWQVISDDNEAPGEETWPLHRALRGKLGTPMVDFIRRFECGRERLVGVSAVPLIGGDGAVTGAIVIVKDISARKETLVEKKTDFSNFRRFADYSTNAFLISNLQTGGIEYMSPTALRLWSGRDRMSTVDEWAQSIHPDDRECVVDHRTAASGGEPQSFQYRIIDNFGTTMRYLRETCFSIPGETGAADGMGAIVEDISPEIQVYVVKCGENSVQDLVMELETGANRLKIFSSQDSLLSIADGLDPGCIVVDLRGGSANLSLIANVLKRRPDDLQVILVGPSDTPVHHVVTAMRAGATDFLLEPIVPGSLAEAVDAAAAALPNQNIATDPKRVEMALRLASLPLREREVLLGLVSGGTNKSIARNLEISPRTVEVHRAHLMDRLNVRSLAELLIIAHDAGYRAI